jgi:hypothetical protein
MDVGGVVDDHSHRSIALPSSSISFCCMAGEVVSSLSSPTICCFGGCCYIMITVVITTTLFANSVMTEIRNGSRRKLSKCLPAIEYLCICNCRRVSGLNWYPTIALFLNNLKPSGQSRARSGRIPTGTQQPLKELKFNNVNCWQGNTKINRLRPTVLQWLLV